MRGIQYTRNVVSRMFLTLPEEDPTYFWGFESGLQGIWVTGLAFGSQMKGLRLSVF